MVRGSYVKGTSFVGINSSESEHDVMEDVKERRTCSRLGTLSTLQSPALKFGEVRQLTLSRQMPHTAAVFPRDAAVGTKKDENCMPSSIFVHLFATPHPKTGHHCNVNQQSSQPTVFNI